MKWAYSVLVPLQKLKEKIKQGFNLYDLAEYFDVDCKYMIDCIDFYAEKILHISLNIKRKIDVQTNHDLIHLFSYQTNP